MITNAVAEHDGDADHSDERADETLQLEALDPLHDRQDEGQEGTIAKTIMAVPAVTSVSAQ